MKNQYIPNFYFVVMADYSNCENSFIENVMRISKQIDSLMNSCSSKIFNNEKVVITPNIEITNRFTDIYRCQQNYYPLSITTDEEILKDINLED